MEPVCAALDASASTYYAAKERERRSSSRDQRDLWLKQEIVRVWQDPEAGRGLYGARTVWDQLKREGVEVARCTVERLMYALGIAGVSWKLKTPRTTVPDAGDRPGDLLERDFTASAPNRRW
ncbi:MAG: IS3 family transposase, partial [Nocardioidaceae bacterium]